MEGDAETDEKTEVTQKVDDNNPEEISGLTDDDSQKERDPVSKDQISEDVDNNCNDRNCQERIEVDDFEEAQDKAEHDPGPPGEDGSLVNLAAGSQAECLNNITSEQPNQSRDSLEDEFLVQEMMTADTEAQEVAANTGHPVTDTDEGDMEAPGEEEIEMLEEIPVISIRSYLMIGL